MSASQLDDVLNQSLKDRVSQHLFRFRRTLETPQGAELIVDGRPCLAFCSNDYLGLANHPGVVHAFQQAANQYGLGGGASHLIVGHSTPHHRLEEELAEFTGRAESVGVFYRIYGQSRRYQCFAWCSGQCVSGSSEPCFSA